MPFPTWLKTNLRLEGRKGALDRGIRRGVTLHKVLSRRKLLARGELAGHDPRSQ
jgi:hypothetical protein